MPAAEGEMARLRAARASLTARNRYALNTLINYASDWRRFENWCAELSLAPLPASEETVGLYLTRRLEDLRVTSVRRILSAIAWTHRERGLELPVSRATLDVLAAAQRDRGEKPRRMQPLEVEELRSISKRLRETGTPGCLLARAVLVLGFATALRRENIAALRLSDIETVPQGVIVHVEREKQDQLARGRLIGVPHGAHEDTCTARCLAAWIAHRGEKPGKLFLHPHNHRPITGDWIALTVRRQAAALGKEPAQYAAHSLRAGFVTAAGEAGLGEMVIASHTGHRDVRALRVYFRRTELFRVNAAGMIGL